MGEVFDRFLDLAMNQDGQIAFAASIGNALAPVRTGLYVIDTTGIHSVALEGQQVNEAILDRISAPSINDEGDIVFLDSTVHKGRVAMLVPNGVYLAPAFQPLSALANAGPPADPQRHPVLSGNFQSPIILRASDGANTVLFFAWRQSTGRHTLWQFAHDELTPILSEGDSTNIGGVYSFIGNLAIASSGRFAFVSNLDNSSAKAGIFVSRINL